jgi:integrase
MAVKIRERKGKWWVFIDHNGKRKAKCVGEKKAAQHVADTIAAKLKLGELHLGDPTEERPARPFGAYFQNWLDTYAKNHCKRSTYAGYEAAFRLYLKPRFGERDLAEITRPEVKQLANEMLAQGKSRSTVKMTLAPLSEMFNHAIEDGHFTAANPVLRILRRNRTDEGTQHEKVTFLTRDEVTRLLTACREHFAAFYPLVLCLVRTGMRIGEAIALQWGDTDFAGRFADVKRNLVDGHLTTPKSGKQRRVDLSTQLTETFKALLVERKKETLRHGWGEVPAWVFVNECGNPLDPENFRHRVWGKILAKAQLRRVRIHDLRHTYASLLIQQGESLAYVKEQMGHHSIRVTVDTYGHLVPGGNKAAVDRLDDPAAQADATPAQPTQETAFSRKR